MKKLSALILTLACVLALLACDKDSVEPVRTVEGNIKTYVEMSDGTWQFDSNIYKYRLEITGRMHAAAVDSTFIFLSNIANIPFDRAWKAAGYSSNTEDYFDVKDAVLVEMK